MDLGFFSLLGLAFIIMKITGVISWAWWLVLLPIYGGVCLVIALSLLFVLIAAIGSVISDK